MTTGNPKAVEAKLCASPRHSAIRGTIQKCNAAQNTTNAIASTPNKPQARRETYDEQAAIRDSVALKTDMGFLATPNYDAPL
jgi:hypothetical protein